MKLLNKLILFFVFSILLIDASAQDRGLKPNGSKSQNIGGRYVLAIGVDTYENWPSLDNAANDAVGLRKVLIETYGYEDVHPPLVNSSASYDSIWYVLRDVVPKKIASEDELIIIFAGHGYVEERKHVDFREVNGYFICHNSESPSEEERFNYISQDEFARHVASLKVKHVGLILDACNSGFIYKSSAFRGNDSRIDEKRSKMSRKALTSAANNQLALDSGPIEGHSIFSGTLIDGLTTGACDLNDDKRISFEEMQNYLGKVFYERNIVQQTELNKFSERYDDAGEIVLIPIKEWEVPIITSTSLSKQDIISCLPFRSSDSTLNSYSNYIFSSLNNALANYPIENVKVLSPDLALRRRGDASQSYAEQFKKLGISKGIVGSMSRIGNEIVFDIEIMDAKNYRKLASLSISDEFPENAKMLKSSVSEIASRILSAISMSDETLKKDVYIPSIEAYDLYQKTRSKEVRKSSKLRRELLEEVIQIDPGYVKPVMDLLLSYLPVRAKAVEEYKKYDTKFTSLGRYEQFLWRTLYYQLKGDFSSAALLYNEMMEEFDDAVVWSWVTSYGYMSNQLSVVENLIRSKVNSIDSSSIRDYFLIQQSQIYLTKGEKDDFYDTYYKSIDYMPWRQLQLDMFFDSRNGIDELKVDSIIADDQMHLERIYRIADILEMTERGELAKKIYHYIKDKIPEESIDWDLIHLFKAYHRLGMSEEVLVLFDKSKEEIESWYSETYDLMLYYKIMAEYSVKGTLNNEMLELKLLEKHVLDDSRSGAYFLGKIKARAGEKKEAIDLFKLAYSRGWGFGYGRYASDIEIVNMDAYKPFLDFVRVK